MNRCTVLLAVTSIAAVTYAADDTVTISTPQGEIEGVKGTARNGDAFFSFRGVPYAQPPVGPLRWRPPRPAAAWHGVRSGEEDAAECWQNPVDDVSKLIGSEDCLYLNVFTKHPGDEKAER